MPKKARKNAPATTATIKSIPPKKTKARSGPQDSALPAGQPSASNKFVRDLLTRGEAAELTQDGKLPLQATHIIQKKSPDGTVEVKRARFKLF